MNHNDAPQMANYPSPPGPAHNGFYQSSSGSQDQRQPDPEGLQLAAQLSGSLAEPMMRQSEAEAAHAQLTGQMEQSQNNAYEGQQSAPLNHQMSHEGLDHGQASGQVYGTPGGTPGGMGEPNKKRTKVSRACDECRRKKIRCDAYSEEENCSNCKRVGTRCQFSRIPQKRGPSKGYIKELSDRVNNLEASQAQARHSMHPADSPYASLNPQSASPRFDDFPSPGPDAPRKRQRSAISTDFATPYNQTYTVIDWAGRTQPQQPQQPHQQQSSAFQGVQPTAGSIVDTSHSSFSADNMAPPVHFHGLPGGPPEQSNAIPGAAFQNGPSLAHLDWSGALEKYYANVHPMLPLLSSSKEKLLARLSRQHCPAILENDLYEAVQSVNKCVFAEGAPQPQRTPRSVLEVVDAPGSRTMATNLLYLQVMLFRVVEAENLGPDSMLQRAQWGATAGALAYAMKLHVPIRSANPQELDPDSDEALGRRLWWCLVILDRWHAISTGSPLMTAEAAVSATRVDKFLLGETAYQLARLSIVQGSLVTCVTEQLNPPEGPCAPVAHSGLSRLHHQHLERCRESFEVSDKTMFNILYLHVLCLRLTIKRTDPTVKPSELLQIATETMKILRDEYTPTPFNHHFATVAAFTLVDLRDICGKEEANGAIQTLIDGKAGRNVSTPGRDWHSAMMNVITKKSGDPTSSQPGQDGSSSQGGGLRHLADLAIAEDGRPEAQAAASSTAGQTQSASGDAETGNGEDGENDVLPESYDPGELIRSGYLYSLASYLPAPAQQ